MIKRYLSILLIAIIAVGFSSKSFAVENQGTSLFEKLRVLENDSIVVGGDGTLYKVYVPSDQYWVSNEGTIESIALKRCFHAKEWVMKGEPSPIAVKAIIPIRDNVLYLKTNDVFEEDCNFKKRVVGTFFSIVAMAALAAFGIPLVI